MTKPGVLIACIALCSVAVSLTPVVQARPTPISSPRNGTLSDSCTNENCQLPNCFCSGTIPPAGLSPSQVPQIVMLTFDDAIAAGIWPYYTELLPPVKNPNGCPMSATFFVSHEWTNYYHVQLLRNQRHEIADHTITHRLPTTWWATATKEEWSGEVDGQRTILQRFGSIEDVRGFRAPFLQPGGNNQFDVLYEGKYMYDSTMNTLQFTNPPIWPYTLDYPTIQECNIPPCPTKSYPGLWEVPLVDLIDKNGQYYAMIDDYHPATEEEAYEYLMLNFNRHYENNRAPFGVFMHAVWFANFPHTVPAMKRFLAKLAEMPDVWLVSVSQALDWIRNPVHVDEAVHFAPWQCDSPAPPVCSEQEAKQCYYPDSRGGKLCAIRHGLSTSNVTRFSAGCPVDSPNVPHLMVTCTSPCPPHYPWYGNPNGN